MKVNLDPGPSQLASSTRVAEHFGRSRAWGLSLLKEWWQDQQRGGIPRVVRRGRTFYTTMAVLHSHTPRGRDELLYRKIASLENDLVQAMRRIVDLEQRIGRRR